jgi:palmitoyl-protein thioesterase
LTSFRQAQYFRDPNHLDEYLASNVFLTSINNELSDKNETYKENLASLENFVLIMFTEDTTSIPKESAWFGSEAPPEEMQFPPDDDQRVIVSTSSEKAIIPMWMHPIYTEDWIGLRRLDLEGRLVFETCEGEHMHIDRCWEPVVRRYCGGLL